MEPGKPVSQPLGEFQGRAEALSVSVVVEHEETNEALATSRRRSSQRVFARTFLTMRPGEQE
jgi:hypothetical protein